MVASEGAGHVHCVQKARCPGGVPKTDGVVGGRIVDYAVSARLSAASDPLRYQRSVRPAALSEAAADAGHATVPVAFSSRASLSALASSSQLASGEFVDLDIRPTYGFDFFSDDGVGEKLALRRCDPRPILMSDSQSDPKRVFQSPLEEFHVFGYPNDGDLSKIFFGQSDRVVQWNVWVPGQATKKITIKSTNLRCPG